MKLNIPRHHSGNSTSPEMLGGVDGIASSHLNLNLSLLNDAVGGGVLVGHVFIIWQFGFSDELYSRQAH